MLSVIMCTYNNPEEVRYTLASLNAQKNQEFETVVIDGGSDAQLVELLRPHADILISEPDAGLYNAFNKGMRAANREFITYMNAGDGYTDETAIDTILSTLQENPERDLFIFRTYILGRKRIPLYIRPRKHNGREFTHQAVVIRRTLQERYPFNEDYQIGGDSDLWRRMRSDKIFNPYLDDAIIAKFTLGGRSSDMRSNTARSIERLWSRYQLGEHIPDRVFIGIYLRNKISRILARFPALIETFYTVRSWVIR